jgi:hypothetical protein
MAGRGDSCRVEWHGTVVEEKECPRVKSHTAT